MSTSVTTTVGDPRVGGYQARNAVQVPATAMAEPTEDEEEENGAQQGRPRPRLRLLGEGALNRRGAWAGAARSRPGTSRPRLGGSSGGGGGSAMAHREQGPRGSSPRPWPVRAAGASLVGRAPRAADRAWAPAAGARAPTRLHAGTSGPRVGEETVRRGEGRGVRRAAGRVRAGGRPSVRWWRRLGARWG
jgi:hypothetical protein